MNMSSQTKKIDRDATSENGCIQRISEPQDILQPVDGEDEHVNQPTAGMHT